jgi:hypothetical protein
VKVQEQQMAPGQLLQLQFFHAWPSQQQPLSGCALLPAAAAAAAASGELQPAEQVSAV